ncbi:MAG: thiamine phosphate synthase [Flavobacteriaceae bacterium]|jgi:thiamine-phosphate pyrophosphorylase|nr:thiamine phosphate synthase [Flavobacteriaceae bacterium]
MIISKLHYISQGNTPIAHLENIQKACASGAELVQLRLKNVSEKNILKLATEAREITSYYQTRLIINEYYKIARAIKADGVHFENKNTSLIIPRRHLYTWQIIGVTANTLQDCETLISKIVDYIGLGPFRVNTSKTQLSPALGLNGYTAIAEALKTNTPIIGFGGIIIKDVNAILETGIPGIGVSDAITKDFNTIRTFNQLLNASSTDEQRHTFK